MKIMTFNVRIDVDVDGINKFSNRLEGIIDFLNKEKADVIGFQEVNQNMLKGLIKSLNDYDYVGIARKDNDEYNPIFYLKKYQNLKSNTYWLSETPDTPGSKHPEAHYPRIFTTLTLKINNQIFEIINTHLSHISHNARIYGMNALLNYYKETGKNDFILMGDFNAYPQESVDNIFHNYLNSCWDNHQGEKLTFHDFTDNTIGLPIDYIFTSKNLNIKNVKIHRDKYIDRFLSDHYPVSITI